MDQIKQIPFSYKSREEIQEVVDACKEIGYSILHGLNDVQSIKENIVAVCIDTEEKKIFQLNVTCMCAWSSGKLRPLYGSEILTYFYQLIIKRDLAFYHHLLDLAKHDHSRPIGQLFSKR